MTDTNAKTTPSQAVLDKLIDIWPARAGVDGLVAGTGEYNVARHHFFIGGAIAAEVLGASLPSALLIYLITGRDVAELRSSS